MCCLKYSIPKEIHVAFSQWITPSLSFCHKSANKRIQEEIPRKYKTISVPITKEVERNGKKGEEIKKTISYKLQFIDSTKFMGSSLSNTVDNHAAGIQKIKCKSGEDDKKCQTCAIKHKDYECCL